MARMTFSLLLTAGLWLILTNKFKYHSTIVEEVRRPCLSGASIISSLGIISNHGCLFCFLLRLSDSSKWNRKGREDRAGRVDSKVPTTALHIDNPFLRWQRQEDLDQAPHQPGLQTRPHLKGQDMWLSGRTLVWHVQGLGLIPSTGEVEREGGVIDKLFRPDNLAIGPGYQYKNNVIVNLRQGKVNIDVSYLHSLAHIPLFL